MVVITLVVTGGGGFVGLGASRWVRVGLVVSPVDGEGYREEGRSSGGVFGVDAGG